ncbi:tRNA1(Val) (adenine(37)-N6)-methyltransferase [Robiginitalea aurantiaca]|uniref:tRNA1(Val) (adenine(37)-N6)-methyltransferase n=1 Tax=Robiginitalea aurantiaca TaxID=3056915 RepID=A0ABT7WBL9_9FLAO|nr:methyltransferase [Robiginitalea aurantiaca]MDM9630317.1 methyltransferase [Robiginitalea aurantiaca]
MNPDFRFKAFSIRQDRGAMKVGTDGVLVGAWASLEHNPDAILDIGAGTGLIALMLAQRSGAEIIDAVEADAEAFEECVENFEASPWADRLFCYHTGFAEFASEIEEPYALIVSNPPFFQEQVGSGNPARDQARQASALPFETLIDGVVRLLAPEGRFALILPVNAEASFLKKAQRRGLFPRRRTRVKGNPQASVKRILLELSRQEEPCIENTLTIELERHQYTPEYTELTREFYLKM